jgi:hypothetical protein
MLSLNKGVNTQRKYVIFNLYKKCQILETTSTKVKDKGKKKAKTTYVKTKIVIFLLLFFIATGD